MSLTEISTRVAVVAGLALFALLVIGWRKTAKDTSHTPVGDTGPGESAAVDVEFLSSTEVSRLAASKFARILSLGAIAALLGIILSLVMSLGLSWLVTNIVDRL